METFIIVSCLMYSSVGMFTWLSLSARQLRSIKIEKLVMGAFICGPFVWMLMIVYFLFFVTFWFKDRFTNFMVK